MSRLHLLRPPSLKTPLRHHFRYFQGVTENIFAKHVGHALVHIITGALFILLAAAVLGICSFIAYFRV